MSPHIIGDERTRGSSGRDNRQFVEAMLWIVRTGSPLRDLPEVFGAWNSIFRRFSRWSHKGIWWRIFAAMSDDADFDYLIVDSTIVRAHQHAAGAKKGFRSGPRIKSRASSWPFPRRPEHQDSHGRARPWLPGPLHADAGHKGDAPQADALIEGLVADFVMADAAYDSDRLRDAIAAKGALAVIPNNPSRSTSTSMSSDQPAFAPWNWM
jgi:transposase